jgi:RHS repeat-associated protein
MVSSPRERRFAYASSGLLLAVYEVSGGAAGARADVVYANGVAIAEMDGSGNVFELHADYLGSPRHVTDGGTGALAGGQAFGPYGERMEGASPGGALPWGRRPVTGWTGHMGEDAAGLIYMRARHYSPAWHRFVGPDRGADPGGLNQYAYVGGRVFSSVDPSGLRMETKDRYCDWSDFLAWVEYWDRYSDAIIAGWMAEAIARIELTRQIEAWTKENAGAIMTVQRVEALLKGFPVWLANLLPHHEALLIEFEKAVLLLESAPHWFLNMVTIKDGTAEPLDRFTSKQTWDSFSQTVTAGMLVDWRDSQNAGWRWYIPCWPFSGGVANDCHTTVTNAMGWLGVEYDAARPH